MKCGCGFGGGANGDCWAATAPEAYKAMASVARARFMIGSKRPDIAEPRQGAVERRILFGVAEAHHCRHGVLGIEGGDRNGRDAMLLHEFGAEGDIIAPAERCDIDA